MLEGSAVGVNISEIVLESNGDEAIRSTGNRTLLTVNGAYFEANGNTPNRVIYISGGAGNNRAVFNFQNNLLSEELADTTLDLNYVIANVQGNGGFGLWRGTSSVITTANTTAVFSNNSGDYVNIPALIAALLGTITALEGGTINGVNLISDGSAATYLDGSGVYTTPAGATSGTVTAVTATTTNGVSATVSNQGTTPALTFTLGAITPSSVASAGAISGTLLTMSSDALINSVTIGRGAGNVVTNTTVGNIALFSNTTGTSNTVFGYQSLVGNTTGGNNTSVGHQALFSNLTSSFNTALGSGSLFSNTGERNIALGYFSMRVNTSGSYNTAAGFYALAGNTTGNDNVAFGYNAGRYISDGVTAAATLAGSIFIGYSAKALADGQTNQIVIGYNATGFGSNSTVINNTFTVNTEIRGTAAHQLKVTGSVAVDTYIKTLPVLFANLVAAGTAGNGARAYITNCSTQAFMIMADGAGALHAPVVVVNGVWVVG